MAVLMILLILLLAPVERMASKSFRVWTKDKIKGKLISANKLDEILLKIRTKFEVDVECSIKLVLCDGCEIDDDDSFQTLDNVDLYFLKHNEDLNIPGPSNSSRSASASNSTTPGNASLIELVKKIREKKTGLNKQCTQTRKKRTCNKINIGWLNFENDRYCQVRTPKGGGTRTVDFRLEADYYEVQEKAQELFFPNGTSKKGDWNNFIGILGDFKQNIIPQNNFTVGDYIKKHCLTTKPRVYLMTKPKELDESCADWDLPDLDNFSDSSDLPAVFDDVDVEIASTESMASPVSEVPDVGCSINIGDNDKTLPYEEHSYGNTENSSPVSMQMPRIPSCDICTDRYCDSFLDCGHILCFVCANELEERGSLCHICRKTFSKISKLYY